MPSIRLENICKHICRNVKLEIGDRELMVLLGPSGAGKTTLLNIIAGLTDYEGSVLFDGQRVDKLPASQRGVGYLFQDLFLFPHLDVSANIAYGLKTQKQPHDRINERVAELLQLMKIDHLAERYPKKLSGGEKQRVALARALALSPRPPPRRALEQSGYPDGQIPQDGAKTAAKKAGHHHHLRHP